MTELNDFQPSEQDILDFEFEFGEEEQDIIDLMSKIDKHAKGCIKRFFENKEWYCGGKIPSRELFTNAKIDVVEQIELEDAFDFFHNILDQVLDENPEFQLCGKPLNNKKEDKITRNNNEIIRLVKLLHECERKKIPQSRIGGIVLIFLEVCVGIPLDWTMITSEVRKRKIAKLEQQQKDESTAA